MKTKKLLFYLLAGILGGCIPVMSLHPLYTEENLVFEEKLLGTWVDDSNNIWEFKDANEQEKTYKLIFSDDEGKKGSFVVHLAKFKDRLFLDVFPSELSWELEESNKVEWVYNTIFLIPGHSFIIIDSIEPKLKIRITDDDEMEKLLAEDPNAVKHEIVDGTLVLTASTKELQAFVLKYADDSRVFSEEIILSRKKPKAPKD